MKKYTYKDWLDGKDMIDAKKEYFSPKEWKKVRAKQKELFDHYVDQNFNLLKTDYLLALENSCDMELFVKSGFESLKRIFDTSYRNPSQDLKPGKPIAYYRNIQFIQQINNYNISELRNTFYDLLEGKQSYHLISYPNLEQVKKVDKELKVAIFTSALFKLYKFVRKECDDLILSGETFTREKIKWLGSPSHFGYLFKQLADLGWIEKPRQSYKGLAEVCFKYFDVNTDKFDSFYNEFTASASISEGGKSLFRLKTNPEPKEG